MTVELPDFEEMYIMAQDIGKLTTNLALAEAELDSLIAEITQITSTDEKYFINEKPPSMAYTKDQYHILGIEEIPKELLDEKQKQIFNMEGELEEKKLLFRLYRDIIDVWKTEQFNQRMVDY